MYSTRLERYSARRPEMISAARAALRADASSRIRIRHVVVCGSYRRKTQVVAWQSSTRVGSIIAQRLTESHLEGARLDRCRSRMADWESAGRIRCAGAARAGSCSFRRRLRVDIRPRSTQTRMLPLPPPGAEQRSSRCAPSVSASCSARRRARDGRWSAIPRYTDAASRCCSVSAGTAAGRNATRRERISSGWTVRVSRSGRLLSLRRRRERGRRGNTWSDSRDCRCSRSLACTPGALMRHTSGFDRSALSGSYVGAGPCSAQLVERAVFPPIARGRGRCLTTEPPLGGAALQATRGGRCKVSAQRRISFLRHRHPGREACSNGHRHHALDG